MWQEKYVHVFNYIILVKRLLHYAESESKKSRRSPSPSPEHPPARHSPSKPHNSNLNRRRLDSLSEPIFGKQFCDV